MDAVRPVANELLKRVGPRDLAAFDPVVRRLSRGELLFDTGDKIEALFFPLTALVSLSSTTAQGGSVGVAAIGREGVVGTSFALGDDLAVCRAVVQASGEAIRVNPAAFFAVLRTQPLLRLAVQAFVRIVIAQVVQSAACNRFHTAEQRLARWVLESADRAGTHAFAVTQEFLALMTGLHRPWVTRVIGRLRDYGCIQYRRGVITVLNRDRLQDAACECYWAVRQPFSSGPTPRTP